ncbi:hypothetical protein ACR3K2_37030 [Cryptosporidium serpentis]
MADYGTLEYWEERYKKDRSPYDWYQKWDMLADLLKEYIDKDDRILIIGNGTSRLPEDLYDSGFQNVECMDISLTAVDIMHERLASRGIKCQVSDVLNMVQFLDNEYNIVLDKGTFDTILCSENSYVKVDQMLKEIYRILNKENGKYICISYGQPSYRLTYLKTMNKWDVDVISVKKPISSNIYKLAHNDNNSNNGYQNEDSNSDRPDLFHYIYICKLEKNNE